MLSEPPEDTADKVIVYNLRRDRVVSRVVVERIDGVDKVRDRGTYTIT